MELKKNNEDLKPKNSYYSELYDYNCRNQSINKSKNSYEVKFNICFPSGNLKDLTFITIPNQSEKYFSFQDYSFLK